MKKEIKQNHQESGKVYICPKCKSLNVKKIRNIKTLFGLFPKWKCYKCDTEEIVFPLLDKKNGIVKKSRKKKK